LSVLKRTDIVKFALKHEIHNPIQSANVCWLFFLVSTNSLVDGFVKSEEDKKLHRFGCVVANIEKVLDELKLK